MNTDAPSPSAKRSDPRQQLLDSTIALMSRQGSTGWTLRKLASELGTSHRMLIYHFESLEGLLLAVTSSVEAAWRERVTAFPEDSPDPYAAAHQMWRALAHPDLAPNERLFFELYAAGLQGKAYAKPLTQSAVTDWLAPLTAAFSRLSGDASTASVDARLGLAVVRGLLLDLLATGDLESTTAAHARFLELHGGHRPDSATRDGK